MIWVYLYLAFRFIKSLRIWLRLWAATIAFTLIFLIPFNIFEILFQMQIEELDKNMYHACILSGFVLLANVIAIFFDSDYRSFNDFKYLILTTWTTSFAIFFTNKFDFLFSEALPFAIAQNLFFFGLTHMTVNEYMDRTSES